MGEISPGTVYQELRAEVRMRFSRISRPRTWTITLFGAVVGLYLGVGSKGVNLPFQALDYYVFAGASLINLGLLHIGLQDRKVVILIGAYLSVIESRYQDTLGWEQFTFFDQCPNKKNKFLKMLGDIHFVIGACYPLFLGAVFIHQDYKELPHFIFAFLIALAAALIIVGYIFSISSERKKAMESVASAPLKNQWSNFMGTTYGSSTLESQLNNAMVENPEY